MTRFLGVGTGGAAPRLAVLLAALFFSTGGAAVKAAELSPWQVASFRCAVAAPALFLLLRWWHPGSFRLPTRRGGGGGGLWAKLGAVAVCYALVMVCFVLANAWATAAVATFLQSTAPLYVLLAAPMLLGEKVRWQDLVVIALLAVGMVLFFSGLDAPMSTAPRPEAGRWAGAIAGIFWGLTVLGLRWVETGGRGGQSHAGASRLAVVLGCVVAAVITLPLALETGGWPTTGTDVAVVLYLGWVQIALPYLLLTWAVARLPALEVSLLLLIEPVLAPLWAWWLHGEIPSLRSLAGGAVILCATAGHGILSARRIKGAAGAA
ncbi:MAG: DMT family transporter [Acidobacteriota bacterium]